MFGFPAAAGGVSRSRVEGFPLLGHRERLNVGDDDDVDGTAAAGGGSLGDEVLLASRKRSHKSLGWSLVAVRGRGGRGVEAKE